jgi:hypothetical protein
MNAVSSERHCPLSLFSIQPLRPASGENVAARIFSRGRNLLAPPVVEADGGTNASRPELHGSYAIAGDAAMRIHATLRAIVVCGCLVGVCWVSYRPTWGEEPSPALGDAKASVSSNAPPSKVQPKPLADFTKKGLDYLVAQQQQDGGWGQGGGWRGGANGRREGDDVNDPSDLGNTCIATLAIIRAGSTGKSGPHANQIARAAQFICGQVAKSDTNGLYVTDVRDTQLQNKIGQYVDTFLAGLVLSELKGQMPNETAEVQLKAALDKTVAKIEKNQQEDGTFAGNHGWASVLSQGLCSKFLNRAAQQKLGVKDEVLRRDYAQSVASLDRTSGDFRRTGSSSAGPLPAAISARPSSGRILAAASPSTSDAGVDLYNSASNAGRISYFYESNRSAEADAVKIVNSASASEKDKAAARVELGRLEEVRGAQKSAAEGIVRKLSDKSFVAGFGNNGGEEFLSYMNISEMLVAQGGPQWEQWDKSISANLAQVQNADGSWSGHHCITGRTFCTATALLTLMADRAASQLAAQLAAQQHN